MGNISKCVQLLCLLFESVKQKPQSAHRKKNQPMTEKIQEKSHKQKRQTARILRNPKNPTKPNHKREHRSEGFATTVVQCLSRAQGV